MIPFFIAAWCGHTDDSRDMAQDLVRAFQLAGLKHETAAALMGLTPPQLSRQLAGAEPLNLFRLAYLPIEFHLAWLRLRSQRIGADIITAEQRALLLAAATAGAKKMARVVPDLFQSKRSA